MVNEQINSLARPIKWFSVPRLCRAERPQRGRLREFFQWNIDIIGVDSVLADAEVIFCGIDYLLQAGLTQKDIVVKVSSRKMLAAVLNAFGIHEDRRDALYALLDKKSKLPAETFAELMKQQIADESQRNAVFRLMEVTSIADIAVIASLDDSANQAIAELGELFRVLAVMGVSQFCEFDISIIRGLAYYTGVVFEFYDKAGQLRAIGGGGRYDNLLELLGGPKISATGLGMGDVVLGIILEEKGLLKTEHLARNADYYVAYTDNEFLDKAVEIATALRRKGFITELSYKGGNLGKQLKAASAINAHNCVIIAQEFKDRGDLGIKDMATGEQRWLKPHEL
jgi:histidyl-tRNA synthetase